MRLLSLVMAIHFMPKIDVSHSSNPRRISSTHQIGLGTLLSLVENSAEAVAGGLVEDLRPYRLGPGQARKR